MKTAKQPVSDSTGGSSRRAQPVRQTRTNPPRTTAASLLRTGSLNGSDQPIDIFPAVTHFTDAITALPKDLVRHFTLLKEVDAKVFAPEEALFQLVDVALNAPPPDTAAPSVIDGTNSVAPASAPMSAQNSSSGVVFNGQFPSVPSTDEAVNPALFDPSNLPRRQLFRQTALKIHDMLVSLEEKNHVISGANEALDKQLNRVEDLWPHLENEFSDEAKWGSTTHWAYLENRIAKANNNSQAERSRRDGAAALSAAAQQLAEEAAAKTSERKATTSKKSSRNHNNNQDAETEGRQPENTKKAQSSKARKPAATEAAGVGLGITNPPTSNGTNPAPKRRKVENKQLNTGSGSGPVADKAMNGVFGSNAAKAKPASPRETPVPEPTKKRKALPTSSTQSKKRYIYDCEIRGFQSGTRELTNPLSCSRTAAAASPSVTNSPVIGSFPTDNLFKAPRASPAPSTINRPSSSRARQNSAQTNPDVTKHQQPALPPPPLPSKPSTNATVVTTTPVTEQIMEAPINAPAPATDMEEGEIREDEPPVPPTSEVIKKEVEPQNDSSALTEPNGGSKVSEAKQAVKEAEAKKESKPILPPPTPPTATVPSATPVLTKSGRASKPSTPAMPTFAEAGVVPQRSRSSRASEGANPPKRSHKKGASAAAAAAAAAAVAQAQAQAAAAAQQASNRNGAHDDEEDEAEPTYCYCNQVSYGEMVACDADGCKREWFHLGCVGPKNAPKGNGMSSQLPFSSSTYTNLCA